MDYSQSPISLIVPIIAVISAIVTKRVLLSIFIGIAIGALIYTDWNLVESIGFIAQRVIQIFYQSSQNTQESRFVFENLYIVLFLIFIGVTTQIISHSGAIDSFTKALKTKIKSARDSEFISFIICISIFIDGLFSALVGGRIAKAINEVHKRSLERLAYIIDSTSAPICALIPLSSWGAYNIGLLDSVKIENPFGALLLSIPSNFYAIFAILGVILTILWNVNLPSMKKYQTIEISTSCNKSGNASMWILIIPLATLVISILFLMFYTGYTEGATLMDMLYFSKTSYSLFAGSFLTLAITLLLVSKIFSPKDYFRVFIDGNKSMLNAILILIFAWCISSMIKNDFKSGIYLANLTKEFISQDEFIPLLLFVISSFIAFGTGTSWGTFAIMLPIGLDMSNPQNMILCISAVLSGAVFRDDASPISDTTILSAIGAGCSTKNHFITQLPYALISATCASLAFIIASFSQSTAIALFSGTALMLIAFLVFKNSDTKQMEK